jgi:hypothetical protein
VLTYSELVALENGKVDKEAAIILRQPIVFQHNRVRSGHGRTTEIGKTYTST